MNDQLNTVHNCRAILKLLEMMEIAIYEKWCLKAELKLKEMQKNLKHFKNRRVKKKKSKKMKPIASEAVIYCMAEF